MKRFVVEWIAIVIGVLFAPSCARAQFPAAPGSGPGLPETIEAIDSARVTTRILYITAHPDDESGAVLTYLARGLHADVALLSLTRGEGGQNVLGPEQAPQLGLIRTQELLAATRGYGVKLYFTGARDFGFSKTPEETEKIWGDEVLKDMIRVIREFRPDVVINHWGGVHSGHGHHQTSGLWTPKAVALAADPKAFPELIGQGFLAWNGGDSPVQILDLERGANPKAYVLPLDEVSRLYGKSWRQIGLDAFVNHRTQGISGFINSPFLARPIALVREDGGTLNPHSLALPLPELFGPENDKTCKAHADLCQRLKSADTDLSEARTQSLNLDWPAAVQSLAQARRILDSLIPTYLISTIGVGEWEIRDQIEKVSRASLLAAGFEIRAEAESSDVVLKEPFRVTVNYHCRPEVKCPLQHDPTIFAGSQAFHPTEGDPIKGLKYTVSVNSAPSDPVVRQLNAEPAPLVAVVFADGSDELHAHSITFPVVHIEATSTSVARVPLRLVPACALAVEPQQNIEVLAAPRKPFDVLLRVHSYSAKPAAISVGIDAPDGFHASTPVALTFNGMGDQYAKLTVTPPAKLDAGNYTLTAYAQRGDEKFSTSLEPLPSMPTILWSQPAQCLVQAFDINVPPNLHVGYISAESEPVPDALKRLGIDVEMLDANALNFGDLSKYDAIVAGVRAYELRPELPGANKRLLDYVSQGGTLVVQYNRDFAWDKLQPAPYPAKIGSPTPRITDEHSPVKFLLPNDPLLNFPNKITQADFDSWVQERGLYFWGEFDAKYTALLAMNDPGESDLNGGLVYTHYGKGMYIYTGLAFFRELPEGVPGAYRLFVNLLSASKTK